MAAGLENRTICIIFFSVQLLFGGAIGKLKCRGLVTKSHNYLDVIEAKLKTNNQIMLFFAYFFYLFVFRKI